MWASYNYKLGKDLSDEISDLRMYRLLSDTYDTMRRECSFDSYWATNPVEGASSNAESSRGSQEHQPSQQSEPLPHLIMIMSVPGDAQ